MCCSGVWWKLQLVILWLLGGCIGGSLIIKDKSSSFGLAAETTYFHQDTSSEYVLRHGGGGAGASGVPDRTQKFLHSTSSVAKKRDQSIHSPQYSSASSSSSNSIFSSSSMGGSGGGTSISGTHHNHHHLNNHHHHHRHHHHSSGGPLSPDNLEYLSVEEISPFLAENEFSSGDSPYHDHLRATKVGSPGTSGGSSGTAGGTSGSSTGLDHHHLRSYNDNSDNIYGDSDSASGSGSGGDMQDEELPTGKNLDGPKEQQEKLLLQQLMRGYERDVRPVRNASQPVVVKVGITLTQIFDMDEKNQVLTTNVWLDQEWNDELLRWDPEDFSGLEVIRIPCERIWLPDIVLYNNADDYTRGYMPSRAMVKFDGNVFWPPPTKFRSTCAVDVTYFPFDDQTCKLKLGSWTYNGYQVDVTNRTADIDLDNYVKNGEWDLLRADIKRNVVVYPCCPEPFPDVTITIVIRRKTLYYIYNIVLPCMMLSALTLLVFCLPPDSGEKIALGITVLLAFSVFMLAISEALPETSESIPLIGIYLTAVMAITSISVIVTVVVLNLHYLGPRVRPVPAWLKCLLPEDDANYIRQKSLLIPASHREPRSGSLKRGHVYISHNQHDTTTSDNTRKHSAYMDHPGGGSADEGILKECSSTESVNNENPETVVMASAPPAYDEAVDYSATTEKETPRFRKRRYHQHHPPPRHHQPAGRANSGPSSSQVVSNNAIPASSATQPSATIAAAAIAAAAARRGRGDSSGFIYPLMNQTSAATTTGAQEGGGSSSVSSTADNRDVGMSMCEDLVNAVRYLMSIQEQVEHQNVLVAEWRLVAQAVDRILFWIFACMTIVSSTVLLLILPLYKRSTYYGPDGGTNGDQPTSGDNWSDTTSTTEPNSYLE